MNYKVYLDGEEFFPHTRDEFNELADVSEFIKDIAERGKTFNLRYAVCSSLHPDGSRVLGFTTRNGRQIKIVQSTTL